MRIGEHYHLFVGNIQEFSSQHASVFFFFKQRRGNIKKEREKGKGGREEGKKERQASGQCGSSLFYPRHSLLF